MSNEYIETVDYWDKVFSEADNFNPFEEIRIKEIDDGIHWICEDANSIIDFGCGNGRVLFRCLNRGVHYAYGIDISKSAIGLAKYIAEKNNLADKVKFINGGLEELEKIESNRFCGAILFNIIDNLMPQDSMKAISHIHRIVENSGKILLKLNPYISKEQIDSKKFIEISDEFYKEETGLYLWNLTNRKVEEIISRYFSIESYVEVEFKQYNTINRMYYLKNRK